MTIGSKTVDQFLKEIAQRTPTPGGGAASAVAGAMAAALIVMVANYSQGLEEIANKATKLQQELLDLADQDCLAYQQVVKTKGNQQAIKKAALIPLETFKKSIELMTMAGTCLKKGNPRLSSDAQVALSLAQTAALGAKENVLINLKDIDNREFCDTIQSQIHTLDSSS